MALLWLTRRPLPLCAVGKGGRQKAQDKAQARSRLALLLMALIQVTLGICTLLWVVPVWLGTLHQGGAVLLLSAVIVAGWCWRTRVHSPR